jgi:hypothetical protein
MGKRWLLLPFLGLVSGVGAVSPVLTSISPAGARAGADVELTFSGARLNDTREVMAYSPGFQVLSLDASKTNTVKAVVRVSADCPFGEHQFRLRTLGGITELRTLYVGPFQTVAEREPNNEPAKAQVVAPNTTISGTITSEDIDCFQIQVRKGDRLSAEVEAMRLGRAMFDPYLAIQDPEGRTLAESDDTILGLQDPVVSLIAPRDGMYQVTLRDTSWGGGNDFVYRLHLGNFPRPMVVFPPGGPAGADLALTFLGDPSGPIHQTVRLQREMVTPAGGGGVVASAGGVSAPSANRVRVVDFPNVVESADNHDRLKATFAVVGPPVAFNGVVSRPGEQDWFGFKARRKQPLEIAVFARRVRSPLDSVLELWDAKGKLVESNDDAAGPDSVLKLTPDEDATYYLKIFDQLGGGSPLHVYRIEVRPVVPEVVLNIPEVARNDSQTRQSIAIPRGNRMATLVHVKRTAFNGDLVFQVPGLPGGVTLQADPMPPGVDTLPWVLTAAPDAALAGWLTAPVARPRTGDKPLASHYQHALELVRGNNDQVYYGTKADRLAMAVVQEVPFQLSLEAPGVPLSRGGSLKLRVTAERRPGFEDPINVRLLWNPPGVAGETEVTLPKGKSAVEYAVNAKGDAALGIWRLVVLGSAPFQGGTAYASSDLTPLRVTEPMLAGKIAPVSTEPGKGVSVRCTLECKEPFEGKAVARLIGLPEKISAPEKEITREDKEVVFELKVDPTIPPGSHKNLSCQVVIRKGSDTLVQSVGGGGILRIVPPKKPGTEPARKVASTGGGDGAAKLK